jgi:hypothetical protein
MAMSSDYVEIAGATAHGLPPLLGHRAAVAAEELVRVINATVNSAEIVDPEDLDLDTPPDSTELQRRYLDSLDEKQKADLAEWMKTMEEALRPRSISGSSALTPDTTANAQPTVEDEAKQQAAYKTGVAATPEPPTTAHTVVSLLLSSKNAECLLGDLYEGYVRLHRAAGTAAAERWYWRQLGRSVRSLLWASMRRISGLGGLVDAYRRKRG